MFGIRSWLQRRSEERERVNRSLAIADDEALIAHLAPEVAGMGFVEGGAFVMQEIQAFNRVATREQSIAFASRLLAAQAEWEARDTTMPWWNNLTILREVQAEIASSD